MNIKDLSYQEKLKLLESDDISSEQLKELSDDKDNIIREYVARHKKCSLEILEKLSDDKNPDVRVSVIYNENCSAEIFDKLSYDEYYIIRAIISINKNCPSELLMKLYKEFPDNVFKHSNCPDYLKILLK